MFLAGGLTMKNFTGACGEKESGLRCSLKLHLPVRHKRARFGLAEQTCSYSVERSRA
jgi:hypothetical protein